MDETIVFISARGEFQPQSSSISLEDFADSAMGSQDLSLEEYVLSQIASDLKPEDRLVAAYILNQLDEDGFFREELIDVAEYFHVSLVDVKRIKSIIQKADPVGVGSASPKEAIQVQLEELRNTTEVPEIFINISENYLQELLKKQFKEIADKLGVSQKKVTDAAEFFSKNLNPFPTRAHWGDFRTPGEEKNLVYYNPDVVFPILITIPIDPLWLK